MSSLARTTVWVPQDLWKQVKVAAIDHKVEGGASGIVRLGLEMWLKERAAEKSLKKRLAIDPQINEWFKVYNEERQRWGDLLGAKLRPVKLTLPAARKIKSRLKVYGLPRLLAILYKVPWSPYHMGNGYYASRGPRLAVSNILNITTKINSIEALETVEKPEILKIRGQMYELEQEYKRNEKLNTDDATKMTIRNRVVDEHDALRAELEKLL